MVGNRLSNCKQITFIPFECTLINCCVYSKGILFSIDYKLTWLNAISIILICWEGEEMLENTSKDFHIARLFDIFDESRD